MSVGSEVSCRKLSNQFMKVQQHLLVTHLGVDYQSVLGRNGGILSEGSSSLNCMYAVLESTPMIGFHAFGHYFCTIGIIVISELNFDIQNQWVFNESGFKKI